MRPTALHTLQDIAQYYRVHRTTIMRRFQELGISGVRVGKNKRSPLRFTDQHVAHLEEYINLRCAGSEEEPVGQSIRLQTKQPKQKETGK